MVFVDVSNPPHPELSSSSLDEVAALALAISQDDLRRNGDVIPDRLLVPYETLPEDKRANMRAGVYRTVQALILLGWIDAP